MELPLIIDLDGKQSLQVQIHNQILDLILSGSLENGCRLPSSRDLSDQLDVSRNTIKGAFDKLLEEGYIESRAGSGTYVSTILPEQTISVEEKNDQQKSIKNERPIDLEEKTKGNEERLYKRDVSDILYDFQLERTDPNSFPVKTWRRLINDRLGSAKANMTRYGEPTGHPELRRAIATRLGSTRGMVIDPDQIIILTGIQQGLNIVSHLLVRKGSKVVLEAPGYRGASYLFENYGADLVPVPVDEHGVMIDKLPSTHTDIAFITPSRQFPLCATLSVERRKGLINWAEKVGAYILEVDYDSDFRYEGSPLPAIKSFDDQNSVIYLSSFSKSIGPGLRIGYMVVPPELVEHAKSSKVLLDYGLPWLDQVVLTDFLTTGSFDNYLKRLRRLYISRRDCLVDTLKEKFGNDVDLKGTDCGTHLIWRLPESTMDAITLQKKMVEQQVGIYTLHHHTVSNPEMASDNEQIVMLGYAAIEKDNIREGICRIAARFEDF